MRAPRPTSADSAKVENVTFIAWPKATACAVAAVVLAYRANSTNNTRPVAATHKLRGSPAFLRWQGEK
jgi:hypothetical protein